MAAFKHRRRLADELRNNWDRVLDWMEANLTQARLDAIEDALFPPPTREEKIDRLERSLAAAEEAGETALASSIQARIDALKAGMPAPPAQV